MKKLFVEIEDELHDWLRKEKFRRNVAYKEIIEELIKKELDKPKKKKK